MHVYIGGGGNQAGNMSKPLCFVFALYAFSWTQAGNRSNPCVLSLLCILFPGLELGIGPTPCVTPFVLSLLYPVTLQVEQLCIAHRPAVHISHTALSVGRAYLDRSTPQEPV